MIRKLQEWEESLKQLHNLPFQDSYLLLRQCLLPQVTHLLRCCRPSPEVWIKGDETLNRYLRPRLATMSSQQWDPRLQCLPMRLGGLGLPKLSVIAPHAWQASRTMAMLELLKILPEGAWITAPADTRRQKERTQELWHHTQDELLHDVPFDEACTILDSSSTVGSRWLRCLPLSPRLTFSDEEFAAGLATRLLLRPQVCRRCKIAKPGPTHHDGCHLSSALKIRRHDAVKYRLAEAFEACGAAVGIEPSATASSRRADITVESPIVGGRVAFDITVAGLFPSQASSQAAATTPTEGADRTEAPRRSLGNNFIRSKLEARAERKRYEARQVFFGAKFQPFVLSAGGTLHPEAHRYVKRLRNEDARLADQWYYEVSAALIKSRAAAYMRVYAHVGSRSPPSPRA